MSAETYTVKYPFVRCKAEAFDDGSLVSFDSWKPGTEYGPPDPYTDVELRAHAEGTMTLTVVSRHKPGHYPERVFYTRAFTTPDGKTFGKPALRIATASKFARISKRYGYPYKLEPTP